MALYIAFGFLFITFVTGDKSPDQMDAKRLLLSDPDLLEHRLIEMERKIQILESNYNSGLGGAVYVRWGRKDCPNNGTELVYSGYAGGSYYQEEGAAAEYVCLPSDPLWGDHFDDTVRNHGGHMYGAEYEDSYFGNIKMFNDDVPCAVCRSITRSTHIMIPGRNKCYTGWTQEYSGNLATNMYYYKAASQFVCVDENPVALKQGTGNDNGKLFYPVEAVCGSLACPPYVNGRELTCVICTK